MYATEFKATCRECGWSESWSTDEAARLAAVWHLYEDHPDLWEPIMGARLPLAAPLRPQDIGTRFESWESQC